MSNIYPFKRLSDEKSAEQLDGDAMSSANLSASKSGHERRKETAHKLNAIKNIKATAATVDVAGLLRALKKSTTQTEFMKLVRQELAKLGISHFSIMRIDKSGDSEIRFTRFPCGLNRKLGRLELHRYGIVMDYLRAGNTAPIFLTSIARFIDNTPFATKSMQRNQQAIELCSRFGFDDLYFINTTAARGGTWLFTLGTQDLAKSDFRDNILTHRALLAQIVGGVARTGVSKASSKRRARQKLNATRVVSASCNASNVISKRAGQEANLYPEVYSSSIESTDSQSYITEACQLPAFDIALNESELVLGQQALTLLKLLATNVPSITAAASVMGVSRARANRYVNDIKVILKVDSIAQAVFIALQLGLINLDEKRTQEWR